MGIWDKKKIWMYITEPPMVSYNIYRDYLVRPSAGRLHVLECTPTTIRAEAAHIFPLLVQAVML